MKQQPLNPRFDQLVAQDDTRRKKHEGRMRSVVQDLTIVLNGIAPDRANEFELVFREVTETYSSIFDEMHEVPESDRPAYGVFLKSKATGKECARAIAVLFCDDLDSSAATFNMLRDQTPSFAENIRQGIQELDDASHSI